MLRPTLVLCFGVALFLALGPAPSEGIKCFVCGGDSEVSAAISEFIPKARQLTSVGAEKGKQDSALKIACASDKQPDVVDCALANDTPAGQKPACGKVVTQSGKIGRGCFPVPLAEEMKCNTTATGIIGCVCNTDQCNSSPSLRQKKYGPLSAVGFALLVAYFGFNFTLAHRI